MRSSDWSSDVCSSDLLKPGRFRPVGPFCFQISKFSVDWPHAARLAWIIPVKPGALESAMLSLRYAAPAPELREFISTYYLRSEEHTSELQSLMRLSYAVFCLKKKKQTNTIIQLIKSTPQ